VVAVGVVVELKVIADESIPEEVVKRLKLCGVDIEHQRGKYGDASVVEVARQKRAYLLTRIRRFQWMYDKIILVKEITTNKMFAEALRAIKSIEGAK